MTKSEVRRLFLAKRKALTTDEVQTRSQEIAQHFLDFLAGTDLTAKQSLIHTFLPIRRQNEIDTWLIIRSLWRQFPNCQLVVSVTDTTTNLLTHYPLQPTTVLAENRWGIPEPVDRDTPIASNQIDLVLVPLLAFDTVGHRVGYGKGYYDRFLADCRPDCLKVGLSFFEPVDRIDDVAETDVLLDLSIR
ncbi:5-formyltetrahydrofolate cyclo-ligase [Spirosoma harenae]